MQFIKRMPQFMALSITAKTIDSFDSPRWSMFTQLENMNSGDVINVNITLYVVRFLLCYFTSRQLRKTS